MTKPIQSLFKKYALAPVFGKWQDHSWSCSREPSNRAIKTIISWSSVDYPAFSLHILTLSHLGDHKIATSQIKKNAKNATTYPPLFFRCPLNFAISEEFLYRMSTTHLLMSKYLHLLAHGLNFFSTIPCRCKILLPESPQIIGAVLVVDTLPLNPNKPPRLHY